MASPWVLGTRNQYGMDGGAFRSPSLRDLFESIRSGNTGDMRVGPSPTEIVGPGGRGEDPSLPVSPEFAGAGGTASAPNGTPAPGAGLGALSESNPGLAHSIAGFAQGIAAPSLTGVGVNTANGALQGGMAAGLPGVAQGAFGGLLSSANPLSLAIRGVASVISNAINSAQGQDNEGIGPFGLAEVAPTGPATMSIDSGGHISGAGGSPSNASAGFSGGQLPGPLSFTTPEVTPQVNQEVEDSAPPPAPTDAAPTADAAPSADAGVASGNGTGGPAGDGPGAMKRGGFVKNAHKGKGDDEPKRLQGGEAVMAKKAVQKFAPQLSAMNVQGGGRPIVPQGMPMPTRRGAMGVR